MNITIAEPLRPFSHLPGSTCIVPFSAWKVCVFPSRLLCEHLIDETRYEFTLSLKGPLKEFTVQQDLEEGYVKVFGFAADGYFRYVLKMQEGLLHLCFEKVPEKGIILSSDEGERSISSAEVFVIGKKTEVNLSHSSEKLSLGEHKSQDWPAMRKRKSLSEIFPHWLRLGQIIPQAEETQTKASMLQLLQKCEEIVHLSHKMEVKESFTQLFLAGFTSMLSPRLIDEEYQGIVQNDAAAPSSSALELLAKGSFAIRSLFFQEKEGAYHLLPCLPPDFHAGRFIRIQTTRGDSIDLEWSKKILRKAIIRVAQTQEMVLKFQKEVESFRVKSSLSSRGMVLKPGDAVSCNKGDIIILDRFQK